MPPDALGNLHRNKIDPLNTRNSGVAWAGYGVISNELTLGSPFSVERYPSSDGGGGGLVLFNKVMG